MCVTCFDHADLCQLQNEVICKFIDDCCVFCCKFSCFHFCCSYEPLQCLVQCSTDCLCIIMLCFAASAAFSTTCLFAVSSVVYVFKLCPVFFRRHFWTFANSSHAHCGGMTQSNSGGCVQYSRSGWFSTWTWLKDCLLFVARLGCQVYWVLGRPLDLWDHSEELYLSVCQWIFCSWCIRSSNLQRTLS